MKKLIVFMFLAFFSVNTVSLFASNSETTACSQAIPKGYVRVKDITAVRYNPYASKPSERFTYSSGYQIVRNIKTGVKCVWHRDYKDYDNGHSIIKNTEKNNDKRDNYNSYFIGGGGFCYYFND